MPQLKLVWLFTKDIFGRESCNVLSSSRDDIRTLNGHHLDPGVELLRVGPHAPVYGLRLNLLL